MPAPRRTARPPALTAAQCRAADRYAIEVLGIPGVVLMENAGRNAADLIERWAAARGPIRRRGPVSIVCGRGNNGGDGFVIARHLAMRGWRVSVDLLGDPAGLSADAAVNYGAVLKMGVPMHALAPGAALVQAARRWCRSAVVVDALLGTGFAGEVREPLATVIQVINRLSRPLIAAIDVPSGLNADTGEPGGTAVRAHRTITFLASKTGFASPTARAFTGRVHVADIGAPLALIRKAL